MLFTKRNRRYQNPAFPIWHSVFMTAYKRVFSIGLGFIPWCMPIMLGLALMFAKPPLANILRNLVFDQYQRLAPRPWSPDLPVRVVAIDDESLQRLGQWPWPRKILADLTNQLAAQGAAAIAFDVVFAEEDRTDPASLLARLPALPERDALAQALAAHGFGDVDKFAQSLGRLPVALAIVLTDSGHPPDVPTKTGFVTAGDDPAPFLPRFASAVLPLPGLIAPAAGLGAINWIPDRDLIVRKVPLVLGLAAGNGTDLIPGLDAETLRIAQHAVTVIIKSSNASGTAGFGAATGITAVKIGSLAIGAEADGMVRIHFAGTQPRRHLSAAKVLAGEIPNDEIAGRIMLVGSTAAALADVRSTPLDPAVPGIEIHAELLEHILSGASLARPDYAVGLEAILLVLGSIGILALARFTRPIIAAASAFALLAALFSASFLCFSRADLLFDPLLPGATWFTAYVAMTIMVYRRSESQRQFVRNAFSRYLAPALVARLAKNPQALELGGESREVTVLFCDMREFTRRSEKLAAAAVVDLLNRLLTPLTQAVLMQSGTIDKYLGDGLMAFWNAPLDVPAHADLACRAALAMQAAVASLNAELAAQAAVQGSTHEPIAVGIGLNTGEVFVGNLGSQQRFAYSIIGDPVNVAARLESATKELAVPILVSAATVRAAQSFVFLDLGEISIKGRTSTTPVFALHGPAPAHEDFRSFELLHRHALAAVQTNRDDAGTLITKARDHCEAGPYREFYESLVERRLALSPLDRKPA
jgi:adenylate cyclase